MQWVDTTRYLGVILEKQLTWSPLIDQVRKKIAKRMGKLVLLMNKMSDFSVRNGVRLCKQHIRPIMDFVCPAWRSAVRTHVRRQQVLQSKCFALLLVPPYT